MKKESSKLVSLYDEIRHSTVSWRRKSSYRKKVKREISKKIRREIKKETRSLKDDL